MEDNKAVCSRCGFVWMINITKKGRTDLLCVSCRAKPATAIQYGKLRCLPWSGEFDDWDNPVDGFGFVLPGVRICGHKDCVNPKHIL